MPKIFVINKSDNPLPEHQTESSAGADIHAYLPDGDVIIAAGEKEIIPTGIYIEIPVGYEVQVRPRSGLAFKHGVTVLNSPGTIDADYRGEVKVLLINHGKEDFVVKSGERIAQMVFSKYQRVEWESVNRLSDTERGSGGYGSSGK
ncbi:dUTP diphosphatase [Bacteroidia bacterium]|nr:dUTP diphosphatase [Bacteroidia bacterium]MDA9213612.1 dUTP diphosphatase [Bacteroidia bacterium]